MKKEAFSQQRSLEDNYLEVVLEEPMKLDDIALKVLKADCPDFLIPLRITNRNDQMKFRYKLVNATALEYYNIALTKDGFVRFYTRLLQPFIKGREWFLDYHYICIDPCYVYVARSQERVLFIYVPEASFANTDEEIMNFFKSVLSKVRITDNPNILVRLFQYFNSGMPTLGGIREILEEEGTAGNRAFREDNHEMPAWGGTRNAGGSGAVADPNAPGGSGVSAGSYAQVDSYASGYGVGASAVENSRKPQEDPIPSQPAAKPSDEDLMESLFGSPKKQKKEKPKKEKTKKEKPEKTKKNSSFFSFGNKAAKKEEAGSADVAPAAVPVNGGGVPSGGNYSYSGYGSVIPDNPGGEYTEPDEEGDGMAMASFLELIYSEQPGAPNRISLDFQQNYIEIGRASSDPVKPDVAFPSDFMRIGRHHVRVERRAAGYYIIDLGSPNGTLLNGTRLAPNCPYRLENGMELSFTESHPVKYRVHL